MPWLMGTLTERSGKFRSHVIVPNVVSQAAPATGANNVVRGEGRAPEIPATKSARFNELKNIFLVSCWLCNATH